MCAAIERDDASVMNHFDQNRHLAGTLHDLNIVVIGGGNHRRSSGSPDDASLGERTVFRAVEFVSAIGCQSFSLSVSARRSQRRNLAVLGIDNQRRTSTPNNMRSAIPPEVVVRATDVCLSSSIAAVHVVLLAYFRFVIRSFFFARKEFFAGELRRP